MNTSIFSNDHKYKQPMAVLLLPAICVQVYLAISLLIFVFGPVSWPIANQTQFWSLIASYHIAFIGGYWLAVRWKPIRKAGCPEEHISITLYRFFWPLLTIALIAMLIGHRNLTMAPSYIPTSMAIDFYRGLVNPLDGYLYKLSNEAKANFSGNTLVTALYGLLIVSKAILINFLVMSWPKLSIWKRGTGLFVTMIPLISGVSVGTNKPIFDLLFLYSSVLAVNVLLARRSGIGQFLATRKTLVIVVAALIVFCPYYFQHTMSQRAPTLDYVESLSSKTTKITTNPKFKEFCDSGGHQRYQACMFATMASTYLTQGYYGMSLAIEKPFETTYGIGSSTFLLESFQKYLGIDLRPRTFQHKVSEQWSEQGQWHSMYSQWANDIGFWGVTIGMLMLGYVSATIWISAIEFHDFIARCLIPLFVVLFLFIPANNQVFNILETLSTFWLLMIPWIYQRFKAGTRLHSP